MPNPPKPAELKRRQGTYRKDRDPGAGSKLAIVPIELQPEHTPESALEAILEAGVAWLGATDAVKVLLLRESMEERASLRAALLEGHGKRSELRDLDKQIQSLLSELGFDPTARARLGLAEVKKESKLDELRARQAGRSA